ncbi:hypothetical protein HY522_02135 [bacterium]|nr:hypothetical protein [bacterium]
MSILVIHFAFYTFHFWYRRIKTGTGWFRKFIDYWGYLSIGLPIIALLLLLTFNWIDKLPPADVHMSFGNTEIQENYKEWLNLSHIIMAGYRDKPTPDTNHIIIDFLSSHPIGIPEDFSDSFLVMEIPRYITALDAVRYLVASNNTKWEANKSSTILKIGYNLSPDTGVPTLMQTLVAMSISSIYGDSFLQIIKNLKKDELRASLGLLKLYERGLRHSLSTSLKAEYVFSSKYFTRLIITDNSPMLHMTIKMNETRHVWKDYLFGISELALKPLYEIEYDLENIETATEKYCDLKNVYVVNNPMGKILMGTALPKLGSTIPKLNDAIARIRALKIALAMRIYKMDVGDLPETIDILIPNYLTEIEPDPRTGDAYRYSRSKQEIFSDYKRKYDDRSKVSIKI